MISRAARTPARRPPHCRERHPALLASETDCRWTEISRADMPISNVWEIVTARHSGKILDITGGSRHLGPIAALRGVARGVDPDEYANHCSISPAKLFSPWPNVGTLSIALRSSVRFDRR